VTAMNG